MHTAMVIVEENRRLPKIPIHKVVHRLKHFLVGAVFGGMEDVELLIILHEGYGDKRKHGLGRQHVDNRQFQHPAVEVLTQPLVAVAGIEETRLERLHLGKAVRHGVGTDTV